MLNGKRCPYGRRVEDRLQLHQVIETPTKTCKISVSSGGITIYIGTQCRMLWLRFREAISLKSTIDIQHILQMSIQLNEF
jgi:hypothetical protein